MTLFTIQQVATCVLFHFKFSKHICSLFQLEKLRRRPPLEESPLVESPPVESPPVESPPVESPPVESPPVESPPVQNSLKYRRPLRRCPECRQLKVELPGHMQRKHKWHKEKAAKVLQCTNQRIVKKKKTRSKRTACPIAGCSSSVFCLSTHINRCHKQSKLQIHPQDFYTQQQDTQIPEAGHEDDDTTQKEAEEDDDKIEELLSKFIEEEEAEPLLIPNENVEYKLPEPIELMIEEFSQWLQGPQGGGNKKVTATHNAKMVKRVCQDLKVKQLRDLLEDSSLWRLFYQKKATETDKGWSGNTSRTYMVALKKFMGFIVKDVRRNAYSTAEERALAQALLTDFVNWSKSYKRQVGIETARKRIRQAEALLTAEKMKKYRACGVYRKAFIILGQCCDPNFILTARSFVIVRNFLLFSINWRNANRAGVLGEMKVTDYDSKRRFHNRSTGETEVLITVEDHKTLATSGPAKIAMNAQLCCHMDIYRNHIRSKIAGDCPYFFTTYHGTSLNQSSAISQTIISHAKSGGLGHLTSNDCRRSVELFLVIY